MDLLKAIDEVLKSAHEPLHVAVIAEKVISGGLCKSSGKAPEATISARLFSEIRKKGEASAFVKVSPQTFALRNSSARSNVALAVLGAVVETAKPLCANAGFSFKRSGMHWTVDGANAILALRCRISSGQFEDYWAYRSALH